MMRRAERPRPADAPAGKIGGSRRASIDLPAPGGPIIRRL